MCLNPQLRFNPRALCEFSTCKERYLCGFSVPNNYPVQDFKALYNAYYDDSFGHLSNFINYVSSSSYVITSYGHKIPVYLSIPCRKCLECRKQYCSDISSRAILEAYSSNHVVFFTLTYDDDHLPEHGLCKEDVQSGIKRLRTHIKRYINSDIEFTILYVGEYGVNPNLSMRPHYHGLLFFRNTSIHDIYAIRSMFYSTDHSHFYKDHDRLSHWWPYGKRFDFQMARNSNVPRLVSYVSKYIGKQYSNDGSYIDALEKRYNKTGSWFHHPFVQLPHRHGLGLLSCDDFKEYILSGHREFSVTFPNGYSSTLKAPMALLNKIFPPIHILSPRSNLDVNKFIFLYESLLSRLESIPDISLSDSSLSRRTFILRSRLKHVQIHLNNLKYRYRYYLSQYLPKSALDDIKSIQRASYKLSISSHFDWVMDIYQNLIYHRIFDSDFCYVYLRKLTEFKSSLCKDIFDFNRISNARSNSLIKFYFSHSKLLDYE